MAKSILRVSVLIALATVAFLGILSTPLDNSPTWEQDLLSQKAIGFLSAFVFSWLYAKWLKVDKWIEAYDRWCRSNNKQEGGEC